ncbi:DUF6090 family protein [Formosa maritima]|uniref:Uncharacterized protein n=1 Tax=Formosa maritima TaxID=2592046 RepID=A0A5D0G3H4_9FLAO|nr:DUF6090 family protein [Formosa maritima]TYA53200.1 hypothetical protein FVF61_11155 [Formosa maritima]
MIKFFRKIRQQMIKENKVSRYLLYAIGEIVLVVIGILIALQINNSNLEKKDRILEKQYMTSLLNDLESDITNINQTVSGNTELLNGLNDLLKMIAAPSTDLTEQRLLYLYSVKYTYWYFQAEFSDVTLSQLKNAGNFQLIQHHTISEAIINYTLGLEDCYHRYDEIKHYFHEHENTQKSIFNLSLAKKVYEFIEEDNNNMLAPIETFNEMTLEGNYFLKFDNQLFGRYYNDILFYRTTLNNLNLIITNQKQMAEELMQLIKEKYQIQ